MNPSRWRHAVSVVGLVAGILVLVPSDLWAQQGPGRWVADSTYARLYDPATVDTVRGSIVRVDSVTAPRRAARGAGRRAAQRADRTGLHVTVDTGTETVPVHLGPVWYFERREMQLQAGDEIEIVGSRVTFRDAPAVIAAHMAHGDRALRLRTPDGRPVWRGGRR